MNTNVLSQAQRALEKASAETRRQIDDLRRQIETQRRAVRDVQRGLVPLDEMQARCSDVVRAAGERWIRDHALALVRGPFSATGQIITRGLGTPAGDRRLVVDDAILREADPWSLLCALDPEAATRQFEALAARALDHAVASGQATVGPPSHERSAALAAAEAALQRMEAEEEALVDAAIAAGLALQHRPEVRTRRQREADAAAREAERLRQIQQRQDAIDAAHGQYAEPSRIGGTGTTSTRV